MKLVRYSDELIEEVKSSNDIVDVISQYVTLKRSGRNFFGLCPFHKEKSPSFSVSPDKQIFHCFGCGVGGNVIHFISKIENISFTETMELLANRAGITLPTLDNYENDKDAKLKSRVYDINSIVAEFYHQNLYKPTSRTAQEYVKKRKLDNKTLKAFQIGYSGNFDEVYKLASCLVAKSKNGGFIDKFRNRLMFPIKDVRDRVIAFGGRVLDDTKPKYINSPENIVYSKGRHLFGLNVAKRGDCKKILIVEGYMDVISLYQRGITNVVASLGTAMTEAQGRLLRRSCEQVILGYDADGAGQAAILRGLDILQNLGCDIRVLQIQGAKDPDEFVVKYGPDKFRFYMDNAISLVEFKVKVLKKDLDIENVNDKIKFLNQIAQILSKISNNLEREIYIDKISKDYNISKEAIQAEINKLIYSRSTSSKVLQTPIKPKVKENDIPKIDDGIIKRENMFIYLLINYPEESYLKLKDIGSDTFKYELNKKIIKKLYEQLEKGNINTSDVLNWFEETEIINHLSAIMAYDFEISDVGKAIEDILSIYKKESLINKRNKILKELEKASTSEDGKKLEQELNDVIIQLAKMK